MWAWDFVSDRTAKGGKIRAFNLIDEYTRECHWIYADRILKSADVLDCLEDTIICNGAPEFNRSEMGRSLSQKSQRVFIGCGINTLYIESGSPWQNGIEESFNGRFREDCLNRELFYNLKEARRVFADWRRFYNEEGPHRNSGLLPPKEFATKCELEKSRYATLRGGLGSHNQKMQF